MHQLTYTIISCDGNVAHIHLESSASEPVTVTHGKNMQVPVAREEGRYSYQQADWQMSDGWGSDWATIRCGEQVALIAWSSGQFVQRSGSLEVTILSVPVVQKRTYTSSRKSYASLYTNYR